MLLLILLRLAMSENKRSLTRTRFFEVPYRYQNKFSHDFNIQDLPFYPLMLIWIVKSCFQALKARFILMKHYIYKMLREGLNKS